MPVLPNKQVNEWAFFYIYRCGPIFVKFNTGSKRVWVCLYICLVVSVIHLECVQNMSV